MNKNLLPLLSLLLGFLILSMSGCLYSNDSLQIASQHGDGTVHTNYADRYNDIKVVLVGDVAELAVQRSVTFGSTSSREYPVDHFDFYCDPPESVVCDIQAGTLEFLHPGTVKVWIVASVSPTERQQPADWESRELRSNHLHYQVNVRQ